MEDPWSSPWAADSPAKIELPAAPQNAHFSADHLFPRRNSRSPAPSRSRSPGWDDDDAWGGWNGGDGSGSGKESPGWGRSPGLKPLQATPSVRSLSPDPWKDMTLKRLDTTALDNEERKPRGRTASETSSNDRVVDSAISLGEDHELQREKELKNNIPVVVPPLDIDAADDTWRVEVTPEAPAAEAAIPAIHLEQPTFSPKTEGPAFDTVHDKEQDEVLFTADEPVRDEKAVAPQNNWEVEEEQNKSLVTVDEPVHDEEVIAPQSTFEVDVEQNEVLFTADEHVRDEEAIAPHSNSEVEEEQKSLPTIEPLEDAPIVPEQEVSQPPVVIESEIVAESQHQQQELQDDIPPVPAMNESKFLETTATPFESEMLEHLASQTSKIYYPVDLTKLDDLFPSTPPITTEAELVPDVIIDDTFASNSERKAWYRVSRFGSMRKHDLGGDDNYVRVGWSGSQIRERTTQTVRRWMEEDSITGRVVLGRRLGGSGAVMFNWNSQAPQVEIGEFLGRHSRNTSLTVQSAVASPTASSFGWASSVPSSPAVSRHPLANEVPLAGAQRVQSPKPDSARQSLSLEPPPQHTRAHIPSPIQIPPTYPINQDDDDDWGEMMTATPTTTVSFTEDEESASNRYTIPPQSALPFDAAPESPKLLAPKIEKTPSKRPFSWHLGQTLSKPFRRGGKTPSTPSFPSPLSKPMTPPQITPTRHAHTMSASASFVQSPIRHSMSVEDEEIVANFLRDIPDLTYMLR